MAQKYVNDDVTAEAAGQRQRGVALDIRQVYVAAYK